MSVWPLQYCVQFLATGTEVKGKTPLFHPSHNFLHFLSEQQDCHHTIHNPQSLSQGNICMEKIMWGISDKNVFASDIKSTFLNKRVIHFAIKLLFYKPGPKI